MIEKLKSAISQKNNSIEHHDSIEKSILTNRQSGRGQHSRDIQKIFPQEKNPNLNQAWTVSSTFNRKY